MKILKRIDIASMLIVSVISLLVSALDLFGLLPGFLVKLNLDFSKLTLLILSVIGIHLTIDYLFQEKIDDDLAVGIQQIIKSLNGVEIRTFDTTQKLEQYLAKQISGATTEVCDLTWKVNVSLGFDTKPRKAANDKISQNIAKISNKVIYKEVFVFNDSSRIEKLKRRIQDNKPGYSCRYFDTSSKIPRIQFVVIDGEELIFASSAYPYKCAIKHKEIVAIFHTYFNQIWADAIPIKERSVINWDVFNKITNCEKE